MPGEALLQDVLRTTFDEDEPVETMEIFDVLGCEEKDGGLRKRKKISAQALAQVDRDITTEAPSTAAAQVQGGRDDNPDAPGDLPLPEDRIYFGGPIRPAPEASRVQHNGITLQGRAYVGGAEAHVNHLRVGGAVTTDVAGWLGMIDTYDRRGKAYAKGTYTGTKKFADGLEDKPGKRLPKAGVCAEAGVGHARAEWSVFDAEAKGPNACAGAEASVAYLGAKAYARAELCSASASAGPLRATVGIAADTGVGISLAGAELKVLGTGLSIGQKMGVYLFGTGFEFNLW